MIDRKVFIAYYFVRRYPLAAEIRVTHDEMEVKFLIIFTYFDHADKVLKNVILFKELLESCLIDFNTLETKMNYLRSQIQSAEELVTGLIIFAFLFFIQIYIHFT